MNFEIETIKIYKRKEINLFLLDSESCPRMLHGTTTFSFGLGLRLQHSSFDSRRVMVCITISDLRTHERLQHTTLDQGLHYNKLLFRKLLTNPLIPKYGNIFSGLFRSGENGTLLHHSLSGDTWFLVPEFRRRSRPRNENLKGRGLGVLYLKRPKLLWVRYRQTILI